MGSGFCRRKLASRFELLSGRHRHSQIRIKFASFPDWMKAVDAITDARDGDGLALGGRMFSRLFSKITSASHKTETLAGFQVNFGALVPAWERLKDLKIQRDADVGGDTLDVWTLTFERHRVIMFFDQSEHNLMSQGEEPFSVFRLRATFIKSPEMSDFEQAEERFWFRQIDQIRDILPALDHLYPGDV